MRVSRPQTEKISKQALTEGLLYFCVWTFVFLVPIFSGSIFRSDPFEWRRIQTAWSIVAPYFLLFSIHNWWIAKRFLLTRQYLTYAALTVVTVVAIFTAVDFYHHILGIDIGQPDVRMEALVFSHLPLPINLLLGVFMCGLNSGIKMIYKSIRDDQEMGDMRHNMMQAELDYLKYQINPHFFMNTLNNIHALIDIDSEAAKDTVIELSKMMRYVLYDSEQDSISLEKEIQFLQHYIQLMRLRYSDSVEIVVDVPESSPSQVKIPPLIFIVFVENAFKHGISYNSRSYIHISIEVSAEGDRVHYTVSNSKNPSKWKTHGGIGLDNVRKRLDLLFPKRYQLEIEDTAHHYSVELNIPAL
ncbi:MAG: histidine kinase [Rikenellaceae bacterium]|nr:histidine kinase [Rikenellaceae bacterium]